MATLTTIAPDFARLHYALQGREGRLTARRDGGEGVTIFTRGKQDLAGRIRDIFGGRKLARREVDRILDTVAPRTHGTGSQEAIDSARRAARKGRVADLRKHLDVIAAALTADHDAPYYAGEDVNIAGLGKLPGLRVAEELRPALEQAAGGDPSRAAAMLAESLAQTAICSADKRAHLPALVDFEAQGRDALAEFLQGASPLPMTRAQAARIVDDAYRAAVGPRFAAVPESCERDPKNGLCVNVAEFAIPDGTRFSRDGGPAGEGSFGQAAVFQSGGRKLLLKWPKSTGMETTGAANLKTLREAYLQDRAHGASGLGRERVMDMERLVFMPDGRWAIAMEVGELRDLYSLQERFPDEDEDVMKLVASDLVEIAAAVRAGEVTHADLKEPNIFITSTGEAKVADFGESRDGDSLWVGPVHGNPTWMDAAAVAASNEAQEEITRIKDACRTAIGQVDESSREGRAAISFRQAVTDAEVATIEKKGATVHGFSADAWALGIMLYRSFTGRSPFYFTKQAEFLYKIEQQMDHYRTLADEERSHFLFPPGCPIPEYAKRAILDLLHPDPASRPTPADVMASGVFNVEPEKKPRLRQRICLLAKLPQGVSNPPADVPPPPAT